MYDDLEDMINSYIGFDHDLEETQIVHAPEEVPSDIRRIGKNCKKGILLRRLFTLVASRIQCVLISTIAKKLLKSLVTIEKLLLQLLPVIVLMAISAPRRGVKRKNIAIR